MTTPSVRSQGTYLATNTTGSPGAPSGQLTGDLMLIVGEWGAASPNTDVSEPAAPSGWTNVAWDVNTSGAASYSALRVIGRIATGDAEAMPTIPTDSRNHIVAACFAIQDHALSSVADLVVGTYQQDASTSSITAHPIDAITCTGTENLILAIATSGRNSTQTTTFSSWTNSTVTLTEIFDQTDTISNGGGFGLATGTLATATSTTGSTVDLASGPTSSVHIAVYGTAPAAGGTTVYQLSALGVG